MPFDYYAKTNSEKQHDFMSLLNSVQYCDICPRMCGRKKVLSHLNGNIYSKVVFIAEAPGRLGAECTGIPLYGDKTGHNFEMLLGNIGWCRENIFITNAILCNPQDDNGNNGTPTKQEVLNCSDYLYMTLNLINPDVIVTLGIKALESLKYIQQHNFTLKEDVGQCLSWNGKTLFPLYHMSPRAMVHRNIAKQRGDFIKLSHVVDPVKGFKQSKSHKKPIDTTNVTLNPELVNVLLYILIELQYVSMFKVTKLLYLADLLSLERTGQTLTNSIYLRMQDGPWIPTLKEVVTELERQGIMKTTFDRRKAFYAIKEKSVSPNLSSAQAGLLNEVLEKYKDFDDMNMKIAVYRTAPMQYIKQKEGDGEFMLKTPVIYNNKTVMQLDDHNRGYT